MRLPGGVGGVDHHQVRPRRQPPRIAAEPAARVVRLDQAQGVRPGFGGGGQVLQRPLQIEFREAVPVQVLEHPDHPRPVALSQVHGGGGQGRGLGASHGDDLVAGFGRNPRRQPLPRAPDKDPLGGETDLLAVQMVPVGEADVLQPMLQGEGRQALGLGAGQEGVAGLVRPGDGVGAGQRPIGPGQGRLGARADRLAWMGGEFQAMGAQGGGDAGRVGQEIVAQHQAKLRLAARLQGQEHRQQHIQVLVDVDQRQQSRERPRDLRLRRGQPRGGQPFAGDGVRVDAGGDLGLGDGGRLEPLDRQPSIEFQPALPVIEHAQVRQPIQ